MVVLIFEVLLNATSMFNHGNVRIAPKVDGVLRCFVVTPDMHRVHHSILPRETNSNFDQAACSRIRYTVPTATPASLAMRLIPMPLDWSIRP